MKAELHTIPIGYVNVFLLKGEQNILVDAGLPGHLKRLVHGLQKTHTRVSDIDLLFFTHGHIDHIGLTKEIISLSSAKTAINFREAGWLESGIPPLPPGAHLWGRFMIRLMGFGAYLRTAAAPVDLHLGDETISLEAYGIAGQLVHTPGHTLGSMSVLLDSGDAIVGDLAGSGASLGLTPGAPIFTEDAALIKPSWQKLLNLGAETIYPSHGRPFSADVFRRILSTGN